MDLLKERCNFVQKKGQKYVELIVTCDDPELSDNEDEDEYTNLPSVFLELWCVCSYPLYVVTPVRRMNCHRTSFYRGLGVVPVLA